MGGLAEHTVLDRARSIGEERWRDIEKRLSENPINVGSFQLITVSKPERRPREQPRIYFVEGEHAVLGPGTSSHVTLSAGKTRIAMEIARQWGQDTSSLGSQELTRVFLIHTAPPRAAAQTEAKPKLDLAEEARKRLRGNEALFQRLISIAEEAASKNRISILEIEVLPAWSHEYEERTGIVIDLRTTGSNDQRFSLWDAVSSKLDALLDSLTPDEQTFLVNDVSVVVTSG